VRKKKKYYHGGNAYPYDGDKRYQEKRYEEKVGRLLDPQRGIEIARRYGIGGDVHEEARGENGL
jgi:hypothetical protein